MALRPRRRTEEGQVYPALLLAVIGGFAIAIAFLGLQNLLDQTGRAASASDAAALAVGKAHRDTVVSDFAADPQGRLAGFLDFLQGTGPAPAANQVAGSFAAANGAQVLGARYDGFRVGQREWVYEVSTRQLDTVEGGSSTARSESTSKVAVTITGGLCADLRGIQVDGTCVDAARYSVDCNAPAPPPPPPPPPSPKPGDPPAPPAPPTADPPPFQAQGYCGASLEDLLQWQIHLVQ
jgi:hypothetical protein